MRLRVVVVFAAVLFVLVGASEGSAQGVAVDSLRVAAEGGDAEAQFRLGWRYTAGDGVLPDWAEGIRWYRLAAEQGHAGAQRALEAQYAAMQWMDSVRLAAEQGDVEAQWEIGSRYGTIGIEGPRDDVKAVRWYRLAAEQGHAGAQRRLTGMYATRSGLPEDDVEAAQWFRLAAEQGDAVAQYELGVMYLLGKGVPEDAVLAYAWINLAAAGWPTIRDQARVWRDMVRETLTREQVAEGQRLSRELADRIRSRRSG